VTRVIVDNSNNGDRPDPVSPAYYIEIFSSKIEDSLDHESVNYPYPIPPDDWVSGGVPTDPERVILDLKQVTEAYQINGHIDIDSNRNSGPNYTANPVSYVETAAERLKLIANTGGVVQLTFIRSSGTTTVKGLITNLKITEDSQEQTETGSPTVNDVQFTFLIGVNAET
jgi:hypothetical protein